VPAERSQPHRPPGARPPAFRSIKIGVDTGGTFTDVVTMDGTVMKVPSTPENPGDAIRQGLARLGTVKVAYLAHGTTVATNAVLEGTLARVALLVTEGFGDLIEIGRQHRPSLADHFVDRPRPLVNRVDRLEVRERTFPDGVVETAPSLDLLPEIPEGVEAIAVCFLHADLNAEGESMVAEAYRARGWDVTASHELSPLFREFERASTTVMNAALRPRVRRYLEGLSGLAEQLWIMTSAGGMWPLAKALEAPVGLALSGPAGGVRAAAVVAAACGFPGAISLDMGGTSTDVCLITGGEPAPAAERDLVGHPVRLPSLDVVTIGAGGGSIGSIDSGGAVAVGPRSAGAVPGPVAYGRGGTEPTVTDANVALGRIPTEGSGALGDLDVAGAAAALSEAGLSAQGLLDVVTANMERALRSVSVSRGIDPAGLALVAFGGAGPLHACELAASLGMAAVIVPPLAGVLSAVGILGAPERHDLTQTWPTPRCRNGLNEARQTLESRVEALLGVGDHGDSRTSAVARADGEVTVSSWLSCRYVGQSHEIEVEDVDDFGAIHQRRNGYSLPDAVIEVVSLRATGERHSPLGVVELLTGADPVTTTEVRGPISLPAADHTVWIPRGWTGRPGPLGSLVITADAVADAVHTTDPNPTAGSGEGDVKVGGGGAGLAVLLSRLTGVADEAGAVLRRAAFSANIKERADCSVALFDAQGRLLVQAEHIPVHLGSMPAAVAAVVERLGDLPAGEQAVVNDPFAGGTHLNDLTLVAPVHCDATLVGWLATRAHHADVGGSAPGSLPADATHIAQEGLRLPPMRFTPEVAALVVANSRTPDERRGDLDAQAGANRVGVERLATIVEELGGPEAAAVAFAEVLDHGERAVAAALARAPVGQWDAADVMDSSGPAPNQREPVPVRVRLTLDGHRAVFDYSASGASAPGNVWAPPAVTISATFWALRSVLDPSLPANAGTFRRLEVVTRPGTVTHAVAPSAVGAGNVEVSQRVADVALGALAGPFPGRVPADSQGTMNSILLGGDGWVSYETVGGGQGGRPVGVADEPLPGMSGVHTAMTNTLNTPIEAAERVLPVRVRRYTLRRGSGGAGRSPGGEGIERELEVLEPVTVSLICDRRVVAPRGRAGGGDGAVGENWLLPGGDTSRAERLPDKCTIALQAGDVLRMLTPGGAAWGPTSS
jgi:5-oxoprolinase (ATP-hydrolysing)